METFIRDLQHQHDVGNKVEVLSVDTRDGASTAALYDIWQFPAILALAEDGRVLNTWQGEQMPLMDEVAAYSYS